MLYVYGLADAPRFEPLPGEGHEAGDVVPVGCGAFAAAVSVLSSRLVAATPQSVWRHERVLERLMQEHTVLPLRFGTLSPDAQALRELLLLSTNEILGDLTRVRGKVEIALRIADGSRGIEPPEQYPQPVPETANDQEPVGRGAAYLRVRLRHHHAETAREDGARQLGQLLRQSLAAVLHDVVCTPPADASVSYRISCLVARDQVAAFSGALDRFRTDHPQFDVTCTGPWPPYSFMAAAPLAGRL